MKIISNYSYNTYTKKNKNSSIPKNISSMPSFSGFNIKHLFKKITDNHRQIEKTIQTYTPEELKNLRERVTQEVSNIIKMPTSQGLSKRLDDLLNSPFIDYKTEYSMSSNLADKISYRVSKEPGNELYKQFVLTSLSKTMPMELIPQERKANLLSSNGTIRYFLENYSKMNENTPQAAQIRKMLERLKENDIKVEKIALLCANSIVQNQPLMSKLYIDLYKLQPDTCIDILTETPLNDIVYFRRLNELFGKPKIIRDTVKSEDFFITDAQKANKFLDSDYYRYSDNARTISLYHLTGLFENQQIRNLFDIFEHIKKKETNISYYKKYPDSVDYMKKLLKQALEYHPELNSMEFIEKYFEKFNVKTDDDIQSILNNLPVNFLENKKILKELTDRISSLKKENPVKNETKIQALTALYDYMKIR